MRPEHLWLLQELSIELARRRDLEELLNFVVGRCREIFEAEGVSILLLDEAGRQLYFPAAVGPDVRVTEMLRDLRIPADRGIAGEVVRNLTPVVVPDTASDGRFHSGVDSKTGMATHSIMAVPLAGRDEAFGALEVINAARSWFSGDHGVCLLSALAGQVSVAVENARLYGALRERAERATAEALRLRRRAAVVDVARRLVGESPSMVEVRRLIDAAAASPVTVLITGETGTGKELAARAIHVASERSGGPFLAINCAELPENLLESELFGAMKGAFTGADRDRVGLFEAANGGTVLLDEIGELAPPTQAKLLRVLQEREVRRIGEHRARRIDVRVIAATHRKLESAMDKGQFREDLYYRLAAFRLPLPPLRERRTDVPDLALHLLEQVGSRMGISIAGFEEDVLAALVEHPWRGNVRELENVLTYAAAFCRSGERVAMRHLPPEFRSDRLVAAVGPSGAAPPSVDLPLKNVVDQFEAGYLRETLARHGGNIRRTAIAIDVARPTLQKKMKKYRLRGTEDDDGQ